MNKRFPVIKYLSNSPNETEINKNYKIWNNIEEMIKNKKLDINIIDNEVYSKFVEYFEKEKNKDILLKIFNEEEFEYIIKENNKYKETKENSKSLINNSKNNNINENTINSQSNINQFKSISYFDKDSQQQLEIHQKHIEKIINEMEPQQILNNSELCDDFSDNASYINEILIKSFYIISNNEEDNNFENNKINNYTKIEKNKIENIIKYYEKRILDEDFKFLYDKLKEINSFIDKIVEEINEEINKKNFIEKKILIIILFFERENLNIDNKNYKINCKYESNLIKKSDKEYIDKDILNNKNYENFSLFLKNIQKLDINLSSISQGENNIMPFPSTTKAINQELFNNLSSISQHYTMSSNSTINEIIDEVCKLYRLYRASPYKIIEFLFLKYYNIGEKSTADYIKIINNNYVICGGYNIFKIYNYINLDFKDKKEIIHDTIYPMQKEKGDNIEIIINSIDKIETVIFQSNGKLEDVTKELNEKISCRFCLYINKTFYICDEEGFFQYQNNILGKIIKLRRDVIIENKSFWGGISINNNIIVLSSNKILPKGEDKLYLYNINNKSFFKEISEYSFTLCQNNLCLIKKEISGSYNMLLLCACKKYKRGQKNGILYITISFNFENIKHKFYETKNFEVFCFCPISEEDNIIFKKDKEEYKNNEIFLVGGFDTKKGKGLIKIFKINYNNNIFENTEINFLCDIIIDKITSDKIDTYKNYNYKTKNKNDEKENYIFKGFNGPITCIYQCINMNKFLVTCFDGNFYIFTNSKINALNADDI